MNLPDLANGLFELGGAAFQLLNVKALMRDRRVQGVHWSPVVFFTAWGGWNLFYYPHLGQWLSFVGGLAIVLVNLLWLTLLASYSRRAAK